MCRWQSPFIVATPLPPAACDHRHGKCGDAGVPGGTGGQQALGVPARVDVGVADRAGGNGEAGNRADGGAGRVPFLQPIAAPSVLGYFSLGSGLILFGTWLARSWGTSADYRGILEFIMLFSGAGQFGAALWSYRVRDAVAVSLHGTWGAFWRARREGGAVRRLR